MGHALVPPRQGGPEDLGAPPGEVESEPELVGVGGQGGQIEGTDHQVVGVEDPRVVGFPGGELERFGAVGAEVDPRPFVDLARDAAGGEERAHHLHGVVDRSRVDDDPAVDVIDHRGQALLDHVGFVTHDHVEADRGPVRVVDAHQSTPVTGW